MSKNSDTLKEESTISRKKQSVGQGFLHGLNERLKALIELQQSQKNGYIHLSPKTNQEIETEIARLKSDTKKMEKQFEKVENKIAENSSKIPSQKGGR